MLKPGYILSFVLVTVIGFMLWHYWQLRPSVDIDFTTSLPTPQQYQQEPITPIPTRLKLDKDKVSLGQILFHDPRLSRTEQVSCASCHNLGAGGVDGVRVSTGINEQLGSVNSPTIFNSAFNFRQFWDGRAANLFEQIDGPIHSEVEMGSNWPDIIKKLQQDGHYLSSFEKIYDGEISARTIKDALIVFINSLITPNSRFDAFLRGNTQALTVIEREGYRRFKAYGCASCHQGVNIGGNLYQTFGVFGDYFADRGTLNEADLGRFNVTGNPQDRHVFKVPGLRNVALTAPYFHDGSAQTLEQAVQIMGYYQLGRHLSSEDIKTLVAFLHTLTGEYQGRPL